MDPGLVPETRTVTRFPCQVQSGGDCKIPSIIYYDPKGNVRAVGAEAVAEGIEGAASEGNWAKAQWFKLHLRPRGQSCRSIWGPAIPPLPPRKTVVQVFADYMKYLFECTKTYITETHANGALVWNSVRNSIAFVLSHPNGWEGLQQTQMRQAAVLAGLIPDNDEGYARVTFTTAGEASLHYCISNGLGTGVTQNGGGVVIVDAGGGTVDISTYHSRDGAFKEITAPQCHFQGSVFVTTRASDHIKGHLKGSRFEEDAEYIADRFDKRTKLAFKSDADVQFIQFASIRETEPSLDIRHGQMKIQGSVVARFFEPSIECIVQAIRRQLEKRCHAISAVFLVGGFAASDWLYKKVKEALVSQNVVVFRPDTHTNKAVSDGAVSFFLDHLVDTRISKFDYGVKVCSRYDAANPEHRRRSDKIKLNDITYEYNLHGQFSVILEKDVQVSETKEFRERYDKYLEPGRELSRIAQPLQCYRGSQKCPEWMDIDQGGSFAELCRVTADVFGIARSVAFGGRGPYEVVSFDVVLLFGLTELRAQIAWMEDGVEKRGPAKIVYEGH